MTDEELREKLEAIIDEPGGGLAGVTERKAARIMQLIEADREAAVREALEPKRVQCFCKVECGKCGNEILVKKMHLFPNDISSMPLQSNQTTNTKEKE